MHNFFKSFLKSFTNFSLYFLQIPTISTYIAVKTNFSNLFPKLFSFSIELSNPTTKHLYFYLGLSYNQKILQMKSFLSFLFFSHKDLLTAWDFTLHLLNQLNLTNGIEQLLILVDKWISHVLYIIQFQQRCTIVKRLAK